MSCHSLHFFEWIKKACLSNVLDKDDLICFLIRDDYPSKVEIQFKKLGDSSLEYFLAPRATREDDEFEGDD